MIKGTYRGKRKKNADQKDITGPAVWLSLDLFCIMFFGWILFHIQTFSDRDQFIFVLFLSVTLYKSAFVTHSNQSASLFHIPTCSAILKGSSGLVAPGNTDSFCTCVRSSLTVRKGTGWQLAVFGTKEIKCSHCFYSFIFAQLYFGE